MEAICHAGVSSRVLWPVACQLKEQVKREMANGKSQNDKQVRRQNANVKTVRQLCELPFDLLVRLFFAFDFCNLRFPF